MRCSLLAIIVLGGCAAMIPVRQSRGDVESLAQRLQRLENMPDAEKAALLQKKHDFDELAPDEREHLRRLHAELSDDPEHDKLRKILARYSEWLKTLTPVERADVMQLQGQQRVQRVKELLRAQEAKRFREMVGGKGMKPGLKQEDMRAIRDWLDEFVAAHAEEIVATLPPDRQEKMKQGEEVDPDRRCYFLRFLFFRHNSPDMPRPTKEDELRLQKLLSTEAQAVLAKFESEEERSRLLWTWIVAAEYSRFWSNPSVEELQKFAQESLDDRERERLMSLPRDEMYQELRMQYNRRRFSPQGEANRGRFPGPPRWPGARRGPDGPGGRDAERGKGQDGGPPSAPGRGRWDRREVPPRDSDAGKDVPPDRGENKDAPPAPASQATDPGVGINE